MQYESPWHVTRVQLLASRSKQCTDDTMPLFPGPAFIWMTQTNVTEVVPQHPNTQVDDGWWWCVRRWQSAQSIRSMNSHGTEGMIFFQAPVFTPSLQKAYLYSDFFFFSRWLNRTFDLELCGNSTKFIVVKPQSCHRHTMFVCLWQGFSVFHV